MRSTTAVGLFTLVASLAGCSSGAGSEGRPGAEADSGEAHDASALDAAALESGSGSDAGETGAPSPSEGGAEGDAGSGGDAAADAGDGCSYSGAPGQCISVAACAALSDHTSFAGYCPGPASIECCIVTPSTADNPPTPTGYMLMAQSQVTAAMTTWAVQILDDPTDYPMFSTAMMTFGTVMVLARVEWHPPDFNNSAVHRGVTLYEPI